MDPLLPHSLEEWQDEGHARCWPRLRLGGRASNYNSQRAVRSPLVASQVVPPVLGRRLRGSSASDASLLGLQREATTASVWKCACAEGAELRCPGHLRFPGASILGVMP